MILIISFMLSANTAKLISALPRPPAGIWVGSGVVPSHASRCWRRAHYQKPRIANMKA